MIWLQPASAATSEPQVLATITSRAPNQLIPIRTLVLRTDGSFHSVETSNGSRTTMDVNNTALETVILIQSRLGVTTKVLETTALQHAMQAKPSTLAAGEASLRKLLSKLHMQESDLILGTTPLMAGHCAAEQQALSQASSAMTFACIHGTAEQCNTATYNYIIARDNYDSCMDG